MSVGVLDRAVPVQRRGLAQPGDADLLRAIPIETPVAFEYNGIGYAVMMATPGDLEAFAVGFSLAEGLIAKAGDIERIVVHEGEGGVVVRIFVDHALIEPVIARARVRVSESSCGLCGLESIQQVLRPLPPLRSRIRTSCGAIAAALDGLAGHQPLSARTGAVHAAAFCSPDGAILAVQEDVGRHNALDKLVGRLALDGVDHAGGFILLTARCSYELVEKTVRAGCPMLVTVSAPTSLATERAAAAGLTLVALARPDSMLVLNDPHESIA